MKYWIFDLDNTLYMTKNIIYEDIKKDYYLRCLINSLDGKKIIFTNAILSHAEAVLKQLGIRDLFYDVIYRTRLGGIKPDIKVFKRFLSFAYIENRDECIFFEDNIINLFTAKKFGWKTILISRNRQKTYPFIDYYFSDIHSAVENFTFNSSQCLI